MTIAVTYKKVNRKTFEEIARLCDSKYSDGEVSACYAGDHIDGEVGIIITYNDTSTEGIEFCKNTITECAMIVSKNI